MAEKVIKVIGAVIMFALWFSVGVNFGRESLCENMNTEYKNGKCYTVERKELK